MSFEEDVARAARRAALENATKHGSASVGAVVGRVMSEVGEARARSKDVAPIVMRIVTEVNAAPAETRAAELASLGGPAAKREKEWSGPLKPLPNAEKGKVVLRFAPNPSGPPHFGHGRGMVITWTYREMYDGKVILRFDDTDTTVKPPWMPAYEMFPESFEWLCGKPDRIVYASDRMEKYVDWALELVRRGGAYVCECEGDTFRALKDKAEACPHRGQSAEENEARFKRMVDGGYRRGAAVLRVKTDIAHKDPAMRDWVAFRIAEEPHPRLAALGKEQHHAWPLLDFQSAIDDHLEGVTHIVRGKDLRDSTGKQEFLYAHLGWTYPETLYWGRVSVHEFGKFSKSILQEAIAKGEFTGWDDPRLPTFPALRRRGFQAEAIRNFWLSFGITEKDIAASAQTLEAENRKVVEPRANRYFFVPSDSASRDPWKVIVLGLPHGTVHPLLHPDHPTRGTRTILVGGSGQGVVLNIPPTEYPWLEALKLGSSELAQGERFPYLRYPPGKIFRLKDLANVRLLAWNPAFVGAAEVPRAQEFAKVWKDLPRVRAVAEFVDNDLEFVRRERPPILQWTVEPSARATLVLPDATEVEGLVERDILNEAVDSVVQLEREGFARVDEKGGNWIRLYFAHK